jgi:Rab GDP dissociation inhibitor
MMISNIHAACKKGYYVNIVSALIETNNPEKELEPAFELLPNYVEKFTTIHEIYEPVTDFSDNVFISKSMDQTSHFENVTENVLYLYKKITGKDLDLTVLPDDE